MGVLEVFELPSHSPIFTKGGGGGALGSHLWTWLGVGLDYSGTPVTARVGILTYYNTQICMLESIDSVKNRKNLVY